MYLVAYIPVLHEGYRALFQKYADRTLLLIGPESVAAELPRLGRDLRALPVKAMRDAVTGMRIVAGVELLTNKSIARLNEEHAEVLMPEDEISREIARRLPSCAITYENVFLRWDKPVTLQEQEVHPDRSVSESERDRVFMEAAKEESQQSSDWWRQVGAVAVRDGEVLFKGYNKHHPSEYAVFAVGNPRDNFDAGEHLEISDTLHGEAGIVARAARQVLIGASIYVTTFPCSNCARLLGEAGVKKVYYRDGYSRLDAETVLKDHGVEIIQVKPE